MLFDADTIQRPFYPEGNKLYLEGHVYVLGLASGMVKVGKTVYPNDRIRAILARLRPEGEVGAQVWVSVPHENASRNEASLLAWCGRHATEQPFPEFFVGVEFADVVDRATSLPFRRRPAPPAGDGYRRPRLTALGPIAKRLGVPFAQLKLECDQKKHGHVVLGRTYYMSAAQIAALEESLYQAQFSGCPLAPAGWGCSHAPSRQPA